MIADSILQFLLTQDLKKIKAHDEPPLMIRELDAKVILWKMVLSRAKSKFASHVGVTVKFLMTVKINGLKKQFYKWAFHGYVHSKDP